jgi:hypothetical protein
MRRDPAFAVHGSTNKLCQIVIMKMSNRNENARLMAVRRLRRLLPQKVSNDETWKSREVRLRIALACIGTGSRRMVRDPGHGKQVELGNCKALNVVSFPSNNSKLRAADHPISNRSSHAIEAAANQLRDPETGIEESTLTVPILEESLRRP